ncbi:unnamed protein product [Larinioides sclopetarius]|uniref:Uncharacterized protein n=1 Tax=Larinioides sclopetarius TaxID=280406 RepID=A0AAV2ATE7_9ARAC
MGIAGRKLFGTFKAGYFHVRVQNLNDTPVMSSVKFVRFPDATLLLLGATSLGFCSVLKWTVCWTLYSSYDMLSSCLLE